MTVLTLEKAAGIPGRLAPYRHKPRAAYTGNRLRGIERACGTDAVAEFVEPLLDALPGSSQARQELNAAYVDWAFDLTGTVPAPDHPLPPPVVPDEGHRVPDCTGFCVQDDVCAVVVADLEMVGGGQLVAEVYAEPGEPVKAVVFTYDLNSDATLLRSADPAELRRKADEFYRFAGRIEHAAYVLEQLQKGEAK